MVTVGRDPDSLYVLPPVTGVAGQAMILGADAVNMEWETVGSAAVGDTAAALRLEIIYYDFSIADSSADIKEAISGSWAKAGEALSFGDIVYFGSDSAWYKSDADTTGTQFVKWGMGFVTADISNGSTGTIMLRGAAKAAGWNWTSVGRDLYADTTAGVMTQSPDTSAGHAVQIIGWSPHPDFIIFNPAAPWARK